MGERYDGPRLIELDEYKKPYLILFNGITDVLGLIRCGQWAEAEARLIQLQGEAEEAYIQQGR